MTLENDDYSKFDTSWKRTMELTGWTQKRQLADFLGIKGQSISGARTRNSFPVDWAYKIAAEFGGNTDWIIDGKGPMLHSQIGVKETCSLGVKDFDGNSSLDIENIGKICIPRWRNPDTDMFDYIPMADAQLSAGGGCFVISENIEGYYAFRKSWLSRVATSVKNLVLMRVHGRSMDPTIQDADTVMIDTGRRDIREGMIYALRVDSTIMIKRLSFRTGGRVLVISDNRQEYEPYEAAIKDLFIIGQIIFFSRTFVPD